MPPEAWVNTLSWPGRAVVCRKDGSYILYNYSGGFSWYFYGPDKSSVLELVELATPDPAHGEVLIAIEAAGVNFLDIQQRLQR